MLLLITAISNLLQAALQLFAVVRSTHPHTIQQNRRVHLYGPLVLSLVIAGLSVWAAWRAQQSQSTVNGFVTGADAFPRVVPQSELPVVNLVVWNHGQAPLTGLLIDIRCDIQNPTREQIGTLPAHGHEGLATALVLSACAASDSTSGSVIKGETVVTYMIDMAAQNGQYVEMLQFKRSKLCADFWPYRFSINRVGGVGYTHGSTDPQPDNNYKLLEVAPANPKQWVGERPGDGKCVPPPVARTANP